VQSRIENAFQGLSELITVFEGKRPDKCSQGVYIFKLLKNDFASQK
jgi:hypothetical protein